MQRLRSFEAFFLVLGLLMLAGAGICGIFTAGSPGAGGFAIAGGLCFVAAAIMYTKSSTNPPPTPTPRDEDKPGAGVANTHIRTDAK
jgi:hypothetical protein